MPCLAPSSHEGAWSTHGGGSDGGAAGGGADSAHTPHVTGHFSRTSGTLHASSGFCAIALGSRFMVILHGSSGSTHDGVGGGGGGLNSHRHPTNELSLHHVELGNAKPDWQRVSSHFSFSVSAFAIAASHSGCGGSSARRFWSLPP